MVTRQILVKRQPSIRSNLCPLFHKKHKNTVLVQKEGKENVFQVAIMCKVLYILNETGDGLREGLCTAAATPFHFMTSDATATNIKRAKIKNLRYT